MNTKRSVAAALLALDVVVAIGVFDTISHFRGLATPATLVNGPLLVPVALLVFAIYLIDGYKARTDMLSLDYASEHAIAVLGAMLATLLLTYAVITTDFELQSSRFVIGLSFLVLAPLTLAYRRVLHLRLIAKRGRRTLVFLGDPASCAAFRAECQRMNMEQRILYSTIVGANDAPSSSSETETNTDTQRPFGEILADVDAGRMEVEAIVLRETARELEPAVSRRLVELYFAGVPTYTLELFHELYWRKIPLYRLNQTWLFQEGFQIAREPVFERIKRASDLALAFFGLVLASPFIAIAATAIWLEDRGPPFFIQTRIGKNHVPFRLWKLRTMRPHSEAGSPYTQPADARVTRIGRFLRATRLDEFPQLWNVLRGDMSLIGPRAEWDRLVVVYESEIPCYHFRHLVKPGITGWAQVNYPYGTGIDDTTRKLEYDLYYIRHFSFVLDASIVLKTIHIMLFGKGR